MNRQLKINSLTLVSIIVLSCFTIVVSWYSETWVYNWKGIRKEIKDSVQMCFDNRILDCFEESKYTHLHMQRRMWIMKNAEITELEKLTEFPDGSIRAIAYEGLLRNEKYPAKKDVLLKAICDTTPFWSYYPSTDIASYLLFSVMQADTERPPIWNKKRETFGMNPQEMAEVVDKYYEHCNTDSIDKLWH